MPSGPPVPDPILSTGPTNPGQPGPGSNLIPTGDPNAAPAPKDPFGIKIDQSTATQSKPAVTREEFDALVRKVEGQEVVLKYLELRLPR